MTAPASDGCGGTGGAGNRQAALRLASFLVGCMGVGISYMVNSFNVYALSLKDRFQLTQIQLEILCSVMFLGLMGSLPGGLLLDQLGARWAAFFAGGVSVGGYVFVWWATLHPLYVPFPWLVLFFLVAGIGGGLTYIVGTAANVRNFSENVRGSVVGVIHAALSAGPGVVMLAWNSFFNNEDGDPTHDDLQGFFIFIAATFGIINFLGMLIYDHYPPEEDAALNHPPGDGTYGTNHELQRRASTGTLASQMPVPFPDSLQQRDRLQSDSQTTSGRTRSLHDVASQSDENSESNLTFSLDTVALRHRALNLIGPDHPTTTSRSMTTLNDLFNTSVGPLVASKKLLEAHEPDNARQVQLPQFFQLDFQLIYWPLIIVLALQMLFIQNLTTIIEAVVEVPSTRDYYNHLFPYITPIFGTIAKPVIGLLSDACIKRISRSAFLVAACVISVLLWLACIFFIDRVWLILVATTLCDLAAYAAYSLGPPLLIERFGIASFARNWALIMCGFSVLVSLLLTIFGAIYDKHALGPANGCQGLMCFEDTCVITTVLSLLATIAVIAYHWRHRQDQHIIDDLT